MKKAIFAILAATIMLLSVLAPSFIGTVNAQITSATVAGNLNSDTYALYPFSPTSLTIGFSQYGEMIDPTTLTGLNYGGVVDPFAPSMNIVSGGYSPPQYEWIEGWILNCTYVSGGQYANIWAMATYSDYAPGTGGIGGAWNQMVTVGSLNLSVRGGRKTSGYAVTTPITVLYNGPREYIATTTTTLYVDSTLQTPLLNVTFTFVFDKSSKDVEVIKDIKRITTSKSIGNMEIQFGDRGEWDLGTGAPPISYAHVFEDQPTVYNGAWQPWYLNAPSPYYGTYDVAQIVSQSTNYTGFAAFWPKPLTTWLGATQLEATRQVILTSIGTQTEDHNFTEGQYEDDYLTPNLTPIDYPQNTSSGTVYWLNDPLVFVNGYDKEVLDSYTYPGYFPDPSTQVYWDGSGVIFPAGYIPPVGSDIRLVYEVQMSKDDMSTSPGPGSPFLIGEWAFMMIAGIGNAFQGVTEYGVTDTHNVGPSNYATTLDREVTYLLAQTFNPTDLKSAVEKNTSRWVGYAWGSTIFTPAYTPAVYVTDQEWDQYNVNSERVEDMNTSTLLHRVANDPLMGDLQQYTVDYTTVFGQSYLTGIVLPATSDYYKITYSTLTWFTYPSQTFTPSFGGPGVNTTTLINGNLTTPGTLGSLGLQYLLYGYKDPLGATHTISDYLNISESNSTALTANATVTLSGNLYDSGSDVMVFKEDTLKQDIYTTWGINQTEMSNGMTLTFNGINLNWTVTAPTLTDLLIDAFNFNLAYTMTLKFVYINSTYYYFTFTSSFVYGSEPGIFTETIPGSYQWGIVGTTAATVDSAGLSMVSAALKDKEVEYGLGASDIFAGASNPSNQMPWIMTEISTAHTDPSWLNYYYNNYGGTYASNNDMRVGLSDAWDPYAYIGTVGGIVGTTVNVPITTSNMIGIGGPLANMLSYYGNDFIDALYASPQFSVGSPWSGNIAALTDWGRLSYSDTSTTGYASISTTQDINGTTMFLLWGLWGRDTYYAAQWFQEEGIYELQQAPCGLTSIILKITYESTPQGYKPTGFSVVQCLGRVSETLWTGTLWGTPFSKGGFHDP